MTVATVETTTGEIVGAHVEPGQNLITWARALGSAHQIATALCTTSFVPRHFAGKPEEAAAALMLGDELGLAPVSALRSIFVIGGTPGMYAKTMVALVQSRGHEVWTEAESATKVTVCGRRAGTDHVERSEWSIDRARRAGYTNNKKYETSPEDMLYARAAATVCRRIAADVLAGIPYTVEELELEEETKPVKAVRRKAEKVTPPEPEIEQVRPRAKPANEDGSPAPDVEGQMKAMHAAFNEAGITERQDRLDFAMGVVSREIESSSDLTWDERSQVIDELKTRIPEPPLDAELVEDAS